MEENQKDLKEVKLNESAQEQQKATDALAEAQALTEMSNKVKTLEAQNAELLAAKRKYYDTIINGNQVDEHTAQPKTAKEIGEELAKIKEKDSLTNLEYVTKSLELDEAVVRETGHSSFLPMGKGISPTADEESIAERYTKFMKQAVNEADGDPAVFNSIIERNVKVMPIKPKQKIK